MQDVQLVFGFGQVGSSLWPGSSVGGDSASALAASPTNPVRNQATPPARITPVAVSRADAPVVAVSVTVVVMACLRLA